MFKDFLDKSKILSDEDQNIEDLDYLYQSFDINPDTIPNLFEESDIEKKYYCKNIISTKNKEQIKSKTLFNISKTIPQLFLEKDIYNIIHKKIDDENMENILNQNLNASDINNALIERIKKDLVIKRKTKSKKLIVNKKEKEIILLGRKRKSDNTDRNHNKYSPDNIMIKIRNTLKKYLVSFINNIIHNIFSKKQRKIILSKFNLHNRSLSLIKKVDYKSIANRIKRKDNLELLNFTIKKFLSFDISSKYKSIKDKSTQYNKLIIDYLCNEIENKDIFDFIFNKLSISNYLDIFTYRNNFSDFSEFKSLNENKAEILEKSLERIENIFPKLSQEGNIYFTCFMLLLYNYKRYYSIKQGRNIMKKTNSISEKKFNEFQS